jgi:maleylpyruvate isomerase
MTVPQDLASDPVATIALCQTAHARLLTTVQGVTDEQVRGESRLPGWTIAHVLTHIARNADGHAVRLDAALRGEDLPRYPGGTPQRNSDIAGGATRAAAELVDDLRASQARLDQVWERSVTAGWPHRELLGSDDWPTIASPSRRLREVEIHHVDLGLGYEPTDWPDEYVEWELPLILATVPGRVQGEADIRQLVAWLSGRRPLPGAIQLDPWS